MQAPWLLREIRRCAPLIALLHQVTGADLKAIYAGPTMTLMAAQVMPAFKRVFEDEGGFGKFVKSPKPVFTFSADGLKALTGLEGVEFSVQFAYTNDSSNLESMTACCGVWDECGQKENKLESFEAFDRRLTLARSVSFGQIYRWLQGESITFGENGELVVPGASKAIRSALAWWIDEFYAKEGDSGRFGRRLWGTTPYVWGWFKNKVYDRAVKGQDGFEFFNFPTWLNPFQKKANIMAKKATMPFWRWSMMYEGLFTKPAGLIYDCFDYNENTVDDFEIPPTWSIHPGADFGLNNVSGVLIAVDPQQERHPVTGQLYHPLYLIRDYLATDPEDRARAVGSADRKPTKAEHAKAIADGHKLATGAGGSHTEEDSREAFTKAGLPLGEPPVNAVDVQIGCVYEALQLRILKAFRKGAAKTIDDLETYSVELDDNQDPTDKIAEKAKWHRLDALRYIITWLRPPRQVSKVQAASRPVPEIRRAAENYVPR